MNIVHKMHKVIKFTLVLTLFLIITFVIAKKNLSYYTKVKIKEIIFPYKYLNHYKKKLSEEEKLHISSIKTYEYDLRFKESLSNMNFSHIKYKSKIKNTFISYYKPDELYFLRGINRQYPGSAFIQAYKDKLFLVSSVGILAYGDVSDENISFQQIENNINSFINENHFKKSNKHSIRDIFIYNDKIYLSHADQQYEDCWRTNIIVADLNYEKVFFKKFFSLNECVHEYKNKDKEFMASEVGGRITNFDNEHIIVTFGDWRDRSRPQSKKSLMGKIVKINIHTKRQKF